MDNYNELDQPGVLFSEPAEPFRPIPLEVLPDLLSALVDAGSRSIGCDPTYIAMPLLSALGSAIGNTRRLIPKSGWDVPPIIWTGIIGESGTQKSPAFKLITKPIKDLQYVEVQRHALEYQDHTRDLLEYDRELSSWKKKKSESDPPEKPEPPTMKRLVVSDTTIEALAPILLDNPRGVLVATDELATWLGSFNKYSGGAGDSATWLSMYNCDSVVVDRRTGIPPTIFIPSAATSITGTIQPLTFAKLVGRDHRESGLLARLLVCCPPRRPKRWSDDQVSTALLESYSSLLDDLYKLDNQDDGKPVCIGLSRDAQRLYRRFYNDHGDQSAELTGDLAAAFSKLEEHPLRIALILHCCRRRDGAVQADTMETAITLVQWFKYETERVYRLLSESAVDRQMRELSEWITGKHGGTVTATQVLTGRRQIKTVDQAESWLQNMVDAGYGTWINSEPGKPGRPTRRFQAASSVSVCETPPDPSKNGNCADADNADDQKPQTKRLVV